MKVTTATNDEEGATRLNVELEIGRNAWVVIPAGASRSAIANCLDALSSAVFYDETGEIA